MKSALIGLLIGLGIAGCERPTTQSTPDQYESTVLVPVTYFPMDSDGSKDEMKALTIKVMDVDSSGLGVVQIPAWMTGSWAINGSKEFQKAAISVGKIELESSQREIQKSGVPFFDSESLVLGAGVSPSGRLFAIHEGIPKASDADGLYAGYLEVNKRDLSSGAVLSWTFRERNVGYGIGLIQSDPETWTFTRIKP